MSSSRLRSAHQRSIDTPDRHLVLLPETAHELLLALPLVYDLQQRYPARPLDVMTTASLMELAQRLANLGRVWQQPSIQMSWKTFWRAGIDLQGQGYQRAWVLPDQFKPALIPALANIPERTGYRGAFRYALLIDIRLARKDLHPHRADRYRALAWDIGEPLPPSGWPAFTIHPESQQAQLKKWNIDPQRPVIILAPQQAPWTQRTPPAQALAALQSAQAQGAQLVLVSSRHHVLAVEAWKAQLQGPWIDTAGQLSWSEVMDLFSLAEAVWADDGPLALLALALGRLTHCLSFAPDEISAAAWI